MAQRWQYGFASSATGKGMARALLLGLVVAAGGMALPPRWWVGASALGFAITVVVYGQAATALITLPPRLDPIAMRLAGWGGLAAQVEAARTAAGAQFVVADSYAVTSELAWWLPPGKGR